MKRIFASFAVAAAGAAMLGGCDTLRGIDRPAIVRNTGLGDACADFMRLSYPGLKAELTIDHVDVANTQSGGLALMIVDVQATRPDIPATGGFLAKKVAARCRFQNGILTQFRWTEGPFR